jgi:hypothetical protein
MSNKALIDLTSDEFRLSLGVVTSAAAPRRCLQRSPYMHRLRAALRFEIVSESGIRRFVSELSARFQRGAMFFDEPALAAIAVALETRSSPFVDEYLNDLAKLGRIAEFHLAPGVAVLCLREQRHDRAVQHKQFRAFGVRHERPWSIRSLNSRQSLSEPNVTIVRNVAKRERIRA